MIFLPLNVTIGSSQNENQGHFREYLALLSHAQQYDTIVSDHTNTILAPFKLLTDFLAIIERDHPIDSFDHDPQGTDAISQALVLFKCSII